MATRYVNTASSPGGDGTTNATSGANRAYASLAEFEATLTGTLSEAWTSHCSGATADTTAVTFGGFTPSEDHYVEVIGDYSGEGYDEDQYHMVRTANDGAIISVNVGYMRLRRLQIYHAATANGDYNPSAIFVSSGLSGITLVDRCLLRGTELSTQGRPRGLVGLSTVHAVNTVFWGWRGAGSTSDGFQRAGGAGSLAYHCTAYDCRRGFTTGDDGQSGANQLRLINCVAAACVDGFAAGWVFGTGSDYNASDLASDAPGANSRNSQTFSWVDAAIGLLRPTESDAAVVGYGTDLSGDGTRPVSVDITGTTRPDPPSIGAYEPTGGGGPVTYHESLSLAAAAALAPSGALVMSATQSLAASAALAPSAALVIGATVALAADAAITTPSQAALVGAVALPADATITPTSTAALVATLALQGTGGLGLTAQATLGASLALPAEAGLGVVSQATVDAALALVASGTLTPAGAVVAQAVLALGLEAGYVTSAQIVGAPETHHETLALAAAASLEIQATGLLGAVQAFAAAAGLTQDAATVIGRALALAVAADLTTAAQGVLRPTLALPVDATLTSQAQAQLVALLTLSAAAVLAQAAQLQGVITYDVLKVAAETLRAAAVTHETLRAARALDETLH